MCTGGSGIPTQNSNGDSCDKIKIRVKLDFQRNFLLLQTGIKIEENQGDIRNFSWCKLASILIQSVQKKVANQIQYGTNQRSFARVCHFPRYSCNCYEDCLCYLMTKNRIILTKQSGRPLKLKVVIRCRKK